MTDEWEPISIKDRGAPTFTKTPWGGGDDETVSLTVTLSATPDNLWRQAFQDAVRPMREGSSRRPELMRDEIELSFRQADLERVWSEINAAIDSANEQYPRLSAEREAEREKREAAERAEREREGELKRRLDEL